MDPACDNSHRTRRGAEAFIFAEGTDPHKDGVPVRSGLLIGRGTSCDFPIDDPAASRRHVEIVRTDQGYRFRDLGSTNGTLHNGVPCTEGVLRSGDRLSIGSTTIVFEQPDRANTEVVPPEVVSRTVLNLERGEALPAEQDKAAKLLRAIYSVSNDIATTYELCPLVDRILHTTIRAVHAKRGALFFSASSTGELMPCAVCNRVHVIEGGELKKAEGGTIHISRSVAHHVLEGGESVLYQDKAGPENVGPTESIESLRLRSIICVPLRGKYGILGVLYMDTDRPGHLYTHDDLLLSTAVGVSAGLALENARFHQEILKKRRTEQEIEHAWAIQQGFLPHRWPGREDPHETYGMTRPARIVGGDFYDYVSLPGGIISIVIGDVSGKGVPAALTMAQLLAELRLLAQRTPSPLELVVQLNRSMYERTKHGMFVSCVILSLDRNARKAVWANAGHLPPLRITRSGAHLLSGPTGPPLGILPEGPWEEQRASLEKGDTVLLLTDGVLEARHGSSEAAKIVEEFGAERLKEVAARQWGKPVRELIEAINAEVDRFCAPFTPHDDLTMIAVRSRQ